MSRNLFILALLISTASLIQAARWVADLLSRADTVPAIDVTPAEGKAA